MRRVSVIGLCVSVCGAVLLSVTARAAQDRQILVSALDKDDVPVTGLTTADFEVREDGAPRPVTAVETSKDGLAIMLLIDTGKSPVGTPEPTRDVRAAVQTFVKTIAASGLPTQMAIMDYAGAGTMLRGFTEKLEDVERSAARLVPSQRANSVLLETLPGAARDVAKRPGPRRVIVVLDRGSLETSRVEQEKVVSAIGSSGVSIWAVTVSSPQVSSPVKEVALEQLSEDTGGRRITAVSTAALEGMMKKVADALVSQYAVTYTAGGGTPKSIVARSPKGVRVLRAPLIR